MALSLCRTTVDDSARELMEHGTAAFPIACYHDDLQAEPVPWHWHEGGGTGRQRGHDLGDGRRRKFRLEKGEGLFINAGVLRRLAAECGQLPPAQHGVPPTAGGRQPGQCVLAEISAAAADRPQPSLRRAAPHGGLAARGHRGHGAGVPRGGERNPRLRVQDPRGAVGDDLPAGQPRSGGAGHAEKRHCATPTASRRCCNLSKSITPRTSRSNRSRPVRPSAPASVCGASTI